MLIVICGATATGKSGLAIAIAQRLNSPIISADSRQIYREFDIATAKVSIPELALVPHHLVSTSDPDCTVTLAEYQSQAQELIDKFHQSEQIPLLVGGTGLYIKSVVKGLKMPRVSPQPDLRSQLLALGQVQCYQILAHLDRLAAQKIHPHDATRTVRALEVYYVTGKTISSQQDEDPPSYPILQIGLDCERVDLLGKRIEHRTQQMIALGWEDEVKYLGAKYGWDLPLLDTLGYAEMQQYLQGEVSLTEAIELTIVHTRQFAKRQRTWFRSISEIEWFDSDDPILVDRVWDRVQQFRSTHI
ncbi:tRNA (adenosine(37)-N6)-dimethylallyltransferase MiaA [Chamaesiphon sp. OTE_75_metabat_556]|uniref:tRNA (adenosine(37)-N6)-dimethylallyltransferase MiaA n=1 Tax=Chamaesiphon sp. OTE_75_metabat_556 TaxID=2964692 RepID=UPI00286A3BA2|nr:tRNA (adenosine(37)-N6)-dimethylallyltransferase MiaA [Chamaesiphon sp. OTE_75_metabat_556]